MDRQPPSVADIEHGLRRYLIAHPHASDTARGIAEWWLRDLHPRPAPADIASAIDGLVRSGDLVSLTLPDGQRAFQAPGASVPRASGPSSCPP